MAEQVIVSQEAADTIALPYLQSGVCRYLEEPLDIYIEYIRVLNTLIIIVGFTYEDMHWYGMMPNQSKSAEADTFPDPKKAISEDPRMARPDRDAPHDDRRGGENRAFSNRDWEQANTPTDPERRRAFREKWAQTHLPNLPPRAGYHRCWVSTNHPTDTPARRIALGYNIIKLEDVKSAGWAPEASSVKDGGAVDGAVRWREMIGMECTDEDYQIYMREFHFDAPRDMARDIYAPLEEMAGRVREAGGRVEIGDGFQEMLRYRRQDKQFE